MAIQFPAILHAKKIIGQSGLRGKQAARMSANVPEGFLAVYVGEEQKRRFLVPIKYLNEPSFRELLRTAEEEFGFHHPMGGLTIPCREEIFIDLTARLG